MHRRLATAITAAGLLLSVAASAVAAGGPPNLAFYVDDVRYRTVGTPTDFFGTGAPEHSYDRIYALGSGLINVAETKPGDTDFNGGRWAVYPITWAPGCLVPCPISSSSSSTRTGSPGHPRWSSRHRPATAPAAVTPTSSPASRVNPTASCCALTPPTS